MWAAGVPLVQRTPRCVQGTAALVRLSGLSRAAGRCRWTAVAAGHRRGGAAWRAPARHPADRDRQVALLPDPGAVALHEDWCADRRHLAAGRADGRSGGRSAQPRHRFRRRHQRPAVAARAGRRARPRASRRCRHRHRLARTIAQPDAAQGARTTRDRRLGSRRGALPVEVGPRFPTRLSLRCALHPREGRR
ncbi:MAG: hypothetical protein AW07_03857 [Candidatus Accumulibacter sp. SK-11]|nr:MAG: hypothetical protein AW07_03857 [Candidatus Accumulibacter sp. SK-11]